MEINSTENNKITIFNLIDKTSPGYFTKIKNNPDLTIYFLNVINKYKKFDIDKSVLVRINRSLSKNQSYYAMDLLKIMNVIKLRDPDKAKDDQFKEIYQHIDQSLEHERSMILDAEYTFKLKRTVLEKIAEISKDSAEKAYVNFTLDLCRDDTEVVVNLKPLAFLVHNISNEQKSMVGRKVERAVDLFDSMHKVTRKNDECDDSHKTDSLLEEESEEEIVLEKRESQAKYQKTSNSYTTPSSVNENSKENVQSDVAANPKDLLNHYDLGLNQDLINNLLKLDKLENVIKISVNPKNLKRKISELENPEMTFPPFETSLNSSEKNVEIFPKNISSVSKPPRAMTPSIRQTLIMDAILRKFTNINNVTMKTKLEEELKKRRFELSNNALNTSNPTVSNDSNHYVVLDRFNSDPPLSSRVSLKRKDDLLFLIDKCKDINVNIINRIGDKLKKMSSKVSHNASDIWMLVNHYLSKLSKEEFSVARLDSIKDFYETARKELLDELKFTPETRFVFNIRYDTLNQFLNLKSIPEESASIQYFKNIMNQRPTWGNTKKSLNDNVFVDMHHLTALFNQKLYTNYKEQVRKTYTINSSTYYGIEGAMKRFVEIKKDLKEKDGDGGIYKKYFSLDVLNIDIEAKIKSLGIG